MLGKTIGKTGAKVSNTRDFSPKHQCPGCKPKKLGGDSKYHVNGRPWTRSGQETDQKA